MNSKHQKILNTIFTNPINGNIEWRKIESLLLALNAEIEEGNGSRVTFILNKEKLNIYRPHPKKEALRYRIKNTRQFLINAGIN